MSDAITQIITGILVAEGSEFTDHPADRGGPTRHGITQAALSEHLGRPASLAEIQGLSEADAHAIYYERYVRLPGFGALLPLSEAITRELVDTGVNMGPAVVTQFLQRALNAFNRNGEDYGDIPVDGQCGQKTLTALTAYLKARDGEGERVLLKALNCLQGERYVHIAETRAQNETFVYGWLRARV